MNAADDADEAPESVATEDKQGAHGAEVAEDASATELSESASESDVDIAVGQYVYDLELTAPELIHIRDLFSVISPDVTKTLSQKLSMANGMGIHEAKLWKKICIACLTAGIPVGAAAPDYLATDISQPKIDIFPLNKGEVTTLGKKK